MGMRSQGKGLKTFSFTFLTLFYAHNAVRFLKVRVEKIMNKNDLLKTNLVKDGAGLTGKLRANSKQILRSSFLLRLKLKTVSIICLENTFLKHYYSL